ncbi:hypothetical protein NS226_11725 [Aureimonas ureilytica]|uniref:ABC transporter permease n=1 Tax=Aureimonas ureilytica TaxID=401562 RepID=A0A175R896_9HYPH|nr:hypothetical protein [Aureimonas ureilytica]KTQ95230.1 hypothetical protein NS226_11725 [Aureimonas ureilytica]
MNEALIVAIIVAVVTSATPILIAALGELVVEKSGVLNLGVEGMMLIGAVTGFIVSVSTGVPALGALGGMAAAAAASLTASYTHLKLATIEAGEVSVVAVQ